MANRIDVIVGGKDELSPVAQRAVNNTERELSKLDRQARTSAQGTTALSREITKLTDANEFAAQGVQMFRGALQSIVWGTAIGAASALTTQLIQTYLATKNYNAELKAQSDNFISLAANLNPLLEKSEAHRQAQFNLSVAEFAVAKEMAARGVVESETNLGRLESISLLKELQIILSSFTLTGNSAANRQKALGEEIVNNALKHRELEARVNFLKIVMEASFPTWEGFRRQSDETKKSQDELGRSIQQNAIFFQTLNAKIMEQATEQLPPSTPQWVLDMEEGEKRSIEIMNRAHESLSGFRNREQEALGESIQNSAQLRFAAMQDEIAMNDLRLQSYADTAGAIKNITEAIYIFSGQRSRALFNVMKAASIAEAIMNTYRAANQVLADPTLIGYAKAAAVAATIAAGLANVAKISSTNIGSGGGGGGGIGGASGGGTPTGSLRGSDPSPGQQVQVSVQVNALDPSSVNWDRISENIAESFGRHLGRGGSTGPVTINFERR